MTAFWEWRGRSTVADRPSSVAPEKDALESVELYTRYAVILARVAPDGRRLSDILNSTARLAVRDANCISLLPNIDGTQGEGWTSVSTDDILFAMPPAHTSPRQMRVHRRQHRVRIQTGPYVVVGNAHVVPGIALDPYVLRSRMRFLALTQAHISSVTDPAWERQAQVLLMNVQPIEDLKEVLTIS